MPFLLLAFYATCDICVDVFYCIDTKTQTQPHTNPSGISNLEWILFRALKFGGKSNYPFNLFLLSFFFPSLLPSSPATHLDTPPTPSVVVPTSIFKPFDLESQHSRLLNFW